MLARALEGESTAFDRLVPGANGVRRWMTMRVVPDAAPSGEVHGAFVLMNDIHGLKQAQEALRASEAELRLIMDNVPARVSYIDRDYRYRFLNGHNEEWLGESRKELTGRGDRRGRRRSERFAQLQPLLDRVLHGRDGVDRARCCRSPTGEQRWEAIHYAPQPRRRRQRDRHLRGAHRHPRPEAATRMRCAAPTGCCRRTSATRRSRCWSGTAISGWCAGRRRPRTSSAGTRDEVLGMPLDRQSAAARGRPRRDGRR